MLVEDAYLQSYNFGRKYVYMILDFLFLRLKIEIYISSLNTKWYKGKTDPLYLNMLDCMCLVFCFLYKRLPVYSFVINKRSNVMVVCNDLFSRSFSMCAK